MADPHGDQPLVHAGVPLESAAVAVIMVHGRGATAQGILGLTDAIDHTDIAYLAPQAARNTWYPQSFLAPVEQNEPGRSSGLAAIEKALETASAAGIEREHVVILGFSQGACLASEFVARNPTRYGGLVALSGGLIGDAIDEASYDGDLGGTPAFFGCSDVDPHIPKERVHDSTAVFERLNADVTERLYPGMGHTVNEDELEQCNVMLEQVLESANETA